LQRGVDLLGGNLAGGLEHEVGDRAGGDRHAQRVPVQLALEVGYHQRHRLGRTGGGGDDVQGRGTGATRVLVRAVLQHLVRGVGVHRGHQALDDAELLVQHLRHGGEAVGGAGGVGDDVVRVGVVVALVDTDHEG